MYVCRLGLISRVRKYHLEWELEATISSGRSFLDLLGFHSRVPRLAPVRSQGRVQVRSCSMHTNYSSNVIFFASSSGIANRAGKPKPKPKSNLNFEFEFEPGRFPDGHAQLCCAAIRLRPQPYGLHSYDLIPSQLCSAVQTDNQKQQQQHSAPHRTAPHPKFQGLKSRRAKAKMATGVAFRIQTINLPWQAGECTSSPPSAPLSEPLRTGLASRHS